MEEKNNELFEIDILSLFGALWRRIWVIVLAVVVGGIVAFCIAKYSVTPMYRATTIVYVNNGTVSVGGTRLSISSGELSAATSLVKRYVIILKTRGTLEKVIEKAGVDLTYSELNEMVSAAAINDTDIFKVEVTSSDPKQAQLLANTITEVLPERIESIMDTCSVRVVDAAVKPTTPISPNVRSYTLIGALIGLAASCAVVIIMEIMDNQIRDEEYLIQTYKLPVLAAVPDLESTGRASSYQGRYYRSTQQRHSNARKGGRK